MSRYTRNVIIGNSAAGLSAFESLRKTDPNCEIAIISRERGCAYSLVLLPHFICGRVDKSGLMITDDKYYRNLRAETIFGKKAVGIDIRNQEVVLDDGAKVPYDNLIICTGASPEKIEIEGSHLVPMKSLRNLEDALEVKALLKIAQRFLIVGAGLINLKLISFLTEKADKGFEFTVVEMADQILVNMLDHTAASIIERRMLESGVGLHKRCVLRKIVKGSGRTPLAVLDNGREIETEAVIFNVGVSPNTDLVNLSGIKTNRGIVIDHFARTNIPNIYAAGDVAEAPERVSGQHLNIGNWCNAVEQGKTAALSILGKNQKYEGCLNINITDLFGITALSLGDYNGAPEGGEEIINSNLARGLYQKIKVRDGTVVGGVFVNEKRNGGIFRSILGGKLSDMRVAKIAGCKGGISFGQLINYSKIRGRG